MQEHIGSSEAADDYAAANATIAAVDIMLPLIRQAFLDTTFAFFSRCMASCAQVFKMTALRGLKLVFPADVNPLYAGFGNAVSDMVAYKKVWTTSALL